MISRRRSLHALLGGAATLAAPALRAQDGSVITVLVGAASSMDFCSRLIAEQLRESLGRPAISVAKLGAGQRLALGEVRRAAPDGRTLCFATTGPFAVYPHIYTKLDYDPDRDFTPVAGVSAFDVAISTSPTSGITDLKQLIEWAKAKPQEAMFGSAPGNGSLSHFVGISINLAAGLAMPHVPYKDSGVGLIDLASGRLPVLITGLAPQVPMHKAGRIRLLAVSGDTRSPLVPEVPTLREAGLNISSTTSTGLFGPAGLPAEWVSRLHAALQPMFANPSIKEKLALQAMSLWPVTGAQLAASIADERKRFEQLVKASGFKPLES